MNAHEIHGIGDPTDSESVTDPIYRCPEHGFVTRSGDGDSACPECGRGTERVLPGDRRRRLSKFVSGALRHFPEDAGLELDEFGWADYEDLADAVVRKYDWAGPEHLAAVVATDPKGRFERRETDDGPRIRAAYGHSVDVDPEAGGSGENEASEDGDADEVPDRLYHGTDPANLDAIRTEGLDSMNRNAVHLSEDCATARDVGSRHASDPAVLEIDAERMLADGFRVSKRGEEVYTADEVPVQYLRVLER